MSTVLGRIAFVGGGNMATSIVGGLIARGMSPGRIVVADPVPAQRESLQREYGVATVETGVEAAHGADTVVLAVKPQLMSNVTRAIADGLQRETAPLVVSIAAGIRIADLARWLGPGIALVRSMPNRPAMIGAGVTALYAEPSVDPAARRTATAIMEACGPTVWVPSEDLLDVVTAVSGSGPAYFFLMIEALESAAIELGLEPATARTLAVETAHGAGRMAAASGTEPAELRSQVTSGGGTTAAALEVLEHAGMRDILRRAVRAATERSRALARDFGTDG